MYTTVLFDLDGTLTDPGEGITNSVIYALKKYDIQVKNNAELYKFIGPPLVNSFMQYYGFSKEKAMQAVAYYREYFSTKGLYENKLYSGTVDMLEGLKKAGKKIVLATSKPEKFAREILRYFSLTEYFDFIAGASMDEKRNSKDMVIAYAKQNCPYIEKSTTVMVGDTIHDVLGAKAHKIDCIGVIYGYGSCDELKEAGAKYIAENTQEILNFIM